MPPNAIRATPTANSVSQSSSSGSASITSFAASSSAASSTVIASSALTTTQTSSSLFPVAGTVSGVVISLAIIVARACFCVYRRTKSIGRSAGSHSEAERGNPIAGDAEFNSKGNKSGGTQAIDIFQIRWLPCQRTASAATCTIHHKGHRPLMLKYKLGIRSRIEVGIHDRI